MTSAQPAPSPTQFDFGAGTLVAGRYRIRKEIGRGGYSIVYQAVDETLDAVVAVKVLVPPPASAEVARERLKREAAAIRQLDHPHIVRLYDYVEAGAASLLVMEYVDGTDLATHVAASGPLTPEVAGAVGAGLASALEAAHAHGVLHRDVKPQNVLLDRNGRAKLADFGSAKLEGRASLTVTGGVVGTLAYTAPELLQGGRADARSDIYSLGLTLHFALTRRLPPGGSPHLPPTPNSDGYGVREIDAQLPEWIDEVVRHCTAASPFARFPTAALLAECLDRRAEGIWDSAASTCLICEGPDPFGLAICPACEGTSPEADTIVVVRSPGSRSRLNELSHQISALSGRRMSRVAAHAAAAGQAALVRVPKAAADRVVHRLSEMGISASALPLKQAWRAMPVSYAALLIVVGVTGVAAGLVAIPAFLWLTPLVLLLLAAGAHRALRLTAFPRSETWASLTRDTRARLSEAFSTMPRGTARDLLADLVRLARPSGGDDAGETNAIVDAACQAACEVARMDESLEVLQRSANGHGRRSPEWNDAAAQCERARDALVQRLLEASASLARIHALHTANMAATGPDLGELAAELCERAAREASARREVAALLG